MDAFNDSSSELNFRNGHYKGNVDSYEGRFRERPWYVLCIIRVLGVRAAQKEEKTAGLGEIRRISQTDLH